jgi:hypothetical protein
MEWQATRLVGLNHRNHSPGFGFPASPPLWVSCFGLVWTAAVLLRRFGFSALSLGVSLPGCFVVWMPPPQKTRKTKAAEKHRRSPNQTKKLAKQKRRRSTAAVQTRPFDCHSISNFGGEPFSLRRAAGIRLPVGRLS